MALIVRGAALVASLITVAGAPAFAASPATRAFLANVVPNVDFLDRSSRFALTNSKSKRIKSFAFATASDATRAANALYDWTVADANTKIPLATTEKLDTAATGTTRTGTRNSSASTPSMPTPPLWAAAAPDAAQGAQASTDARLPLGQEDLDLLEGLEGAAFDAPYKTKQADALAQVETDYRDYAAAGDDPALKALATRELTKVARSRAALGKL